MGSGRHGAARPPISVLVRQDRADFVLCGLIIVLALAIMVVSGWADLAFWLAFPLAIGGVTLIVRRIGRLSQQENAKDEELL